jgi:hypothetical protein
VTTPDALDKARAAVRPGVQLVVLGQARRGGGRRRPAGLRAPAPPWTSNRARTSPRCRTPSGTTGAAQGRDAHPSQPRGQHGPVRALLHGRRRRRARGRPRSSTSWAWRCSCSAGSRAAPRS